jgi:hypothetical protein
MKGSSHIWATCPWCGRVELGAAYLRCATSPRSGGTGLCEFTCPTCSRLVLKGVPPEGVQALRAVGARQLAGAVPFEMLEPHPAPPLSWDDVLDISLQLQGDCCPQQELVDSSR